jgi:hypothetical protein
MKNASSCVKDCTQPTSEPSSVDANLCQIPLLLEANHLSDAIQIQFLDDPLHSGEIDTFAIIEIPRESDTKCDLHRYFV